jgi:hypothetical protein
VSTTPIERDPDAFPGRLSPLPALAPTVPQPSMEELESWVLDLEECQATDGCLIEPDGVCEHGHPSWMLYLGLI